MASKEPADPSTPNAKEALFFKTILANVKNLPDIDWDTVATESGYANGATAKKRYQQIKAKLGWGGEKPSPSKGRAATAKKDVGSGTNEAPSKVTKSRGRPRKNSANAAATAKQGKVAKAEDDDEDSKWEVKGDDEEEEEGQIADDGFDDVDDEEEC